MGEIVKLVRLHCSCVSTGAHKQYWYHDPRNATSQQLSWFLSELHIKLLLGWYNQIIDHWPWCCNNWYFYLYIPSQEKYWNKIREKTKNDLVLKYTVTDSDTQTYDRISEEDLCYGRATRLTMTQRTSKQTKNCTEKYTVKLEVIPRCV